MHRQLIGAAAMQLLKYAFACYHSAPPSQQRRLREEEAERGELSPCFPSDRLDMTCAAGQIMNDKKGRGMEQQTGSRSQSPPGGELQ